MKCIVVIERNYEKINASGAKKQRRRVAIKKAGNQFQIKFPVIKGDKKLIYQNELAVDEYYWFNPFNCEDWAGFELIKGVYQPISPDIQNRLISPCLGLALVRWHGTHDGVEAVWLRWATLRGELLLSPQEAREQAEQRANQAEQRAIIEAKRAKEAEAEIARLKALLADKE